MRLIPAALPPQGGRRGWTLGVSLLLHALAVLALLLMVRRPETEPGAAPGYELLFEAPPGATPAPAPDAVQPEAPSATPESPPAAPPPSPAPPEPDALPGPAAPPPLAPPVPEAPAEPAPAIPALPDPVPPPPVVIPMPVPLPVPPEPQPVPQPVPVPVPEPVPEPQPAPRAAPTPAPPAAPEPIPETPAPDPVPTAPPQVRLQPPAAPAPAPPLVPDLVLPPPPPLPPQPPVAPARPRTAPPPSFGSLSNPLDLNFRATPERPAAPRTGAAPGSVASRSLDLTPGAPKPGASRADPMFDARAAALGADWMEGVRAYWLRHRYYPLQAAQNGENGTVDVELTVNRYGKVQAAIVKSRSGSSWLDMAAVGTFRNAQLPPLPPEIGEQRTVTISIHYQLIR